MSGRRRKRAFARAVAAADALRDAGRPAAAAEAYLEATAIDPAAAFAWVQRGNMLKDSGRPAEAIEAYHRALSLHPDDADAMLQIARAHQQLGQPAQAIEAYVTALGHAPDHRDAAAELLALGVGMPTATRQFGMAEVERMHVALGRLRDVTARLERALPPLRSLTVVSLDRYDLFREANRVGLPPQERGQADGAGPSAGFVVLGGDAQAGQLLECLATIVATAGAHRPAVFIVTPGEGADALRRRAFADPALAPPVVLAPTVDESGMWSALDAAFAAIGPADLIVLVSEAALVHPCAAAWLRYAKAETGAVACYADSDRVAADGTTRISPQFLTAFDALALEEGELPGPLLAIRAADLATLSQEARLLSGAPLPALLARAALRGPVAHVPRVLASVTAAPAGTVRARPPKWPATGTAPDGTIEIVIPTRDRVDLLIPCIDAFRRQARSTSSLLFHVVDTGSTDSATLDYLERCKAEASFRVTRLDEPFNWSRANNIAARSASAAYLLFANNDIEMLAPGWDDLLRRRLSRPDVGAIGGLLVYPDRRIQHAGIVLGHDGHTEHEARREPEDAAGPGGRWQRARAVGAVTGALLGCRADVFRAAGGFDEVELPVWFNDIDFCLRIRRAGLNVLYEPGLKALHHESLTIRSTHGGESGQRLFHLATRAMSDRWGEMFTTDPYYNPHYSRHGIPFKTLCEPSESEIVAHIRQSVRVGRAANATWENDRE